MSDKLRITGLATGLDVDTMVKTLMKAESIKLDKLKQDKQILQWKQELYREILGDINTFKSSYFDVLKSDTYMLSSNSYAGFDAKSIDVSTPASSTVGTTVTAGVGAAAGDYKVEIINTAKSASKIGTSLIKNTATVTFASGKIDDAIWGKDADTGIPKSIDFTVGDKAATITLSDSYADKTMTELAADLNKKIAESDLKGLINVNVTGGSLQFETLTSSTVKITNTTISDLSGLNVALNPSNNTKLSDLGMASGDFPATLNLSYNGTSVSINDITSTMSVGDLIQKINSKTSGNVIASFSQLTGEFTIKTLSTGSNSLLSIDSGTTNGLLNALKLGSVDASPVSGSNAVVKITPPGGNVTTITKSTNNFTLDGISYNLVKEGTTTNISVTSNTQKVYDKIKAFIDKYNENIEKMQAKITEKKQYTYKPLTDEQKKGMEPEDIKAWETKVKQGLLKSDSNLQNMLYSMRSAFFQEVKGAGVSLKEIGLSTDSDYSKGGKIIIDEAKLKDAIQNKGEQVKNIFMKDFSDIPYDPDHKAPSGKDYEDRVKNIGIFQRINDILKDYTRTTRNSDGKKGLLIEKAGIRGDLSEFENLISKEITKEYDKRINNLTVKLVDKENKYYQQFSKLETAMNKLNSQSSWLMQQLGMGGGS